MWLDKNWNEQEELEKYITKLNIDWSKGWLMIDKPNFFITALLLMIFYHKSTGSEETPNNCFTSVTIAFSDLVLFLPCSNFSIFLSIICMYV